MSRSSRVLVFVVFYLSSNFYCLLEGGVLTEDLYSNYTRLTRQAGCAKYQYRCKSGQCIADTQECDGNADCADGSDESTNCLGGVCPPYLFRCDYGACIRRDLTCNGQQNCRDNSDETTATCNNKSSSSGTSQISRPTSQPSWQFVNPSGTTQLPPRLTSEGDCGKYMYKCPSGKCISETNVCDGTVQCNGVGDQNADESEKECKDLPCPPFLYKCRYGACVNGKAECNGIRECIDGSDEDEQKCSTAPITFTRTTSSTTEIVPRIPSQSSEEKCILPPHPLNGRYSILGSPAPPYIPGGTINLYTSIHLRCNPMYIPNQNVSICTDGYLARRRCLRICPDIINTKSTTATCKLNGVQLESCINPVEGTIATLKCEPLYEEPGLELKSTRTCRDGTWDSHLSQCYPVCGRKTPKGTANVIGGVRVVKGDYPWQVAIYSKALQGQHICGGSLLNQRVFISAAHCFTNLETGQLLPIENYDVAAGKYYIGLDDDRDVNVQHARIDKIFVPQTFRGSVNFLQDDIAIVVIDGKFEFTTNVQPVCVDWDNHFEYEQLSENQVGVVTGWGFTKEGENPSEELREILVPYVSYNTCYEQIPSDFRAYLTHDKVCAGFLHQGKSVCQGDSGGGLVFKNKHDRYYIRGIVSTSPTSDGGTCNSNQYSTYTRISSHLEFIQKHETTYRP